MAITPITKKRELFSDFGKDLTLNPVSNDIARKLNEESVKESIRNLVLTDRGERLFQPEIGCDIRFHLFENIAPDTLSDIRTAIYNTIESYEPRCQLIDVDVTGRNDSNALQVTITFIVINSEEPTTLDIVLNRIR